MSRQLAVTMAKSIKYPVSPYAFKLDTTIPLPTQLAYLKGTAAPSYKPYKQLLESVVPLRASFRISAEAQQEKIANQQLSAWRKYLQQVRDQNPSSIQAKQIKQIQEAVQGSKERLDQDLHCSRIAEFVNQYSRAFEIDFNIQPLHLAGLAHPHFGYLSRFDMKLGAMQLAQLFKDLEAASRVYDMGLVVHSGQIQALAYWNLLPKTPLGLKSAAQFLNSFKIKVEPTLPKFEQKFKHLLKNKQGQLKHQKVRFDFWRQLALQRLL